MGDITVIAATVRVVLVGLEGAMEVMASTTSTTTSTTSMTSTMGIARILSQMMNVRGVQLTWEQLRLLSRVNVVQLLVRRRLKLQCTARGTSTMAIDRTLTQMTTARVARRAVQHTRRQPRLVLFMESVGLPLGKRRQRRQFTKVNMVQ